ncbi:CHAD domain-containing protein [Pelagicoccus sp. SDUM812003]|uniref:CHAD domain-containing protein n=1 Tax=Pelagicoccus sp. SDUM812003 TaxID=3041267 RepID=UPI002810732B|nr:CHAD domain-containing protein [Pelagicoccus sp. SDUM812003]MDQ8204363.1 CHAD domain-containing protein [Pelagicoccus sp. SDUM812003]
MAFRIKRKESPGQGLKRILREQIGKAEAELSAAKGEDPHQAIHQARKRCKKIRALYRLVRPELEKVYQRENRRFRDNARRLATVRDAEAMTEAYDRTMAYFEDGIEDRAQYAGIRFHLTNRRNALASSELDLEERVERFRRDLERGREVAGSWKLDSKEFDGIELGFRKTYKRGRKAMKAAIARPSPKRFHEWRKRVKYHRFHLRALRGIWRHPMGAFEDEMDELGELLGDAHDLHVLDRYLEENRDQFSDKVDLDGFLSYSERLRHELEHEAVTLGRRAYASKPKRQIKWYRKRWDIWRGIGDD